RKPSWLLGLLAWVAVCVVAASLGQVYPVLALNTLALLVLAYLQYNQRKRQLVAQLLSLVLIGSALSFSANYAFNNILERHQQDRINVWLRPSLCDPQGALYNVLQSKMTIGSGGLEGKGFLGGTMTKLNYVPEQSTDFIFCTIGEEQGFIGTVGIIGLFFLLLMRIITLAERQRSDFSRFYAYGVAGILFVHIFINIGMTMGLVPIIGIPLPFISYGGSSILGFSLLIGVLLKLDSNRLIG
ncbi:MAG: rod shape-determining protein RodA, partial [Bacteroidota bacterium]